MRKLFLASMLTLGMAGAAFANNNEIETITPKVEVIQVKQTEKKEVKKIKSCFDFYFSCGGYENICAFGVPFWELAFALMEHDSNTCG